MVLYAELNQGIDSFVRIANFLRRKNIGVKSVNMESENDSNINLKIVLQDEALVNYVINNILKLEDVENIRIM
ncbi:ACT domain-containing protein [Clostridium malenominatum]|uniref:ACT domain-containing protein n=1 Tax=Clostridium malenominatum TaxID=1539 RepID=A0ABN1J3E3_9CLOT